MDFHEGGANSLLMHHLSLGVGVDDSLSLMEGLQFVGSIFADDCGQRVPVMPLSSAHFLQPGRLPIDRRSCCTVDEQTPSHWHWQQRSKRRQRRGVLSGTRGPPGV